MDSELVRAMREWQASPNLFVRQVLRLRPDAWQDEVLEAAGAGANGVPNATNPKALRRICLKASKGPGKSAAESWIGWWFLTCFEHPKVISTSISGDNLRDGLWSEFARWQKRSLLLQQLFTWHSERIFCTQQPETWFASARQWSRSATAEQQGEALAGVHADNVLFLVDEAGGIPDAVVATAEAGLANADPSLGRHALLVMGGNPVRLSGPLYRACTLERELWWIKEISGDPDDPKRASRISLEWARERVAKYGRDHPLVRVDVLGQFPLSDTHTLIGLEDAVSASKRLIAEMEFESDPKILGVDVARFGDDESVILMRQGKAVFNPRVLRTMDLMELTGNVAEVIDKQQPDAVFIDQTGLGSGVVDRLRELSYQVIGIDAAGSPVRAEPKMVNRRAEMWWTMAEWVKDGGALPNDAGLIGELPAPIYKFRSDGAIQLESKEDMKKRGVASPNRADALALTFAAPVAHAAVRNRLARKRQAELDYHPYRR